MGVRRNSREELRQFASQLGADSVADLRIIEAWLPREETEDFYLGFLACLDTWYSSIGSREIEKEAVGKLIAVLAERIVSIPTD